MNNHMSQVMTDLVCGTAALPCLKSGLCFLIGKE